MFSTFTLNYLTIYECSLTGHSMREWKTTKHEQHSRTKKERLKKAEWIAWFKTPFTCLGSNINQSNFQISHKMSWSEDLLSYPHVSDWNISESVVLIWKKTAAGKESSWRLFRTGGRLRPKSLLDYMDLDDHHCWLFSSLCFCLSVRMEKGTAMERGEPCARVLSPAGLPGKGTDLASHHTQPASAYVWVCMWVHLLARECVCLHVTGRVWERRSVSKQRIRKDNRERVRRQRKIKERVWVKKKKKSKKKAKGLGERSHEECDCGPRLHRCSDGEAKG